MAITYTLMTVHRRIPYLHETIASLGGEIPLNLMVGSNRIRYLERYRHAPRFTIWAPSLGEWLPMWAKPLRHRACWNYWRCLTVGVPEDHDLLILEDDVRCAQGWHARFLATVAEIKREHDDFILSLYTYHDFPTAGFLEGKRWVRFPSDQHFFGTQGIFMTPPTRKRFAEVLYERGVRDCRGSYDGFLGVYAKASETPLLVSCPSLIQHIGTRSTGLAAFDHTASSFLESVLP